MPELPGERSRGEAVLHRMWGAAALPLSELRLSQPAGLKVLRRLRCGLWPCVNAGATGPACSTAIDCVRRAAAAHGDVLRSRRLDGARLAARSRGPTRRD